MEGNRHTPDVVQKKAHCEAWGNEISIQFYSGESDIYLCIGQVYYEPRPFTDKHQMDLYQYTKHGR